MKKFLVAILAILYLGTTTGATVHIHYCMGKQAGWSLTHEENKKCGRCGMEKSGDEPNACCSDEQQFFKNDKDQKSSAAFQLLPLVATPLPVSFFDVSVPAHFTTPSQKLYNFDPPRSGVLSIYKRNCVFRL